MTKVNILLKVYEEEEKEDRDAYAIASIEDCCHHMTRWKTHLILRKNEDDIATLHMTTMVGPPLPLLKCPGCGSAIIYKPIMKIIYHRVTRDVPSTVWDIKESIDLE